jgi:hypothetical protein
MNQHEKAEAKLVSKVALTNKVNAIFNDLLPKIQKAIEPFIGKKVINSDGRPSKVFSEVLRAFNTNENGIRIYVSAEIYGVSLSVRAWDVGTYPIMIERSIASIVNHEKIERFYTSELLRTDFTAEEIKANRQALEAAEDKVRELESSLYQFGKYD